MKDVLQYQTFANIKEQNKLDKKSNINSKYCGKYQDETIFTVKIVPP